MTACTAQSMGQKRRKEKTIGKTNHKTMTENAMYKKGKDKR